MSISLKALVELYILQKNHRQNPNDINKKQLFYDKYAELMAETEIFSEEIMAPAMFPNQPDIPVTVFRPKVADVKTPKPLIVHIHGGPNVYLHKDTIHAEIGYFLSHGYVVACPNYRGSIDYPAIGKDKDGWKKWEEKSKGKYHIYGPEDVYAATKHLQTMNYVEKDNISIRGCSFGSFISSHLLVGIKNGKFKNLYRGVHLGSGVNYPVPSSMADNIPLLITHSEQDEIAPFESARFFMEKILLKQLSYEIDDTSITSVHTYIAKHGNHHFIHPDLQVHSKGPFYDELVHYLELTTNFIHAISKNAPFQLVDSYDQFKAVMNDKPAKPLETSDKILSRVYFYNHVSPNKNIRPFVKSPISNSVQKPKRHVGPTMALLKLYLKEQFTENIKEDLVHFLMHHFAPIEWAKERKKLTNAGKLALGCPEFINQSVEMIEKEEAFLSQHPNYMVMYHAAENDVVQLYGFINLWKTFLQNGFVSGPVDLKEMRLFDFIKKSIEDIDVFLIKMRHMKTDKTNDVIFNNLPGFAARAIAANPTMISNAHSTASCSFWWYLNSGALPNHESPPVEAVIADLLKTLGIYSSQRVARYIQLFEREMQRLNGESQALMQQIFVPYKLANKRAYLCQIWGEEFKKGGMELHSPEILSSLRTSPEAFEQELRNNQDKFTNFGNCEGFGETQNGFHYAGALQIRYLVGEINEEIVINSYFRAESAHQQFMEELKLLIAEDYTDFLACRKNLPECVISKASTIRDSLWEQLLWFKPPIEINDEPFFYLQRELYKGLVQNPDKETYGGIIAIGQERKKAIQKRLRDLTGNESNHRVFLYSLCNYLEGYTYYDLIMEAAEFFRTQHALLPPNYIDWLKTMLDIFCVPASVDKDYICGNDYLRLSGLINAVMNQYQCDSNKHTFLQPKGTPYYESSYLWDFEKNNAIECVLKQARLAKEKGYGHDTSERKVQLY